MPDRPETAEEYAARVASALGPDGRLPLAGNALLTWDIFPFEVDGLRLRQMAGIEGEEPPRQGEDAADCPCREGHPESDGWSRVWQSDGWDVNAAPPSGSPLVLSLFPREHHDVGDLPDALAAELGSLLVGIVGAVEALPSVGRCHVSRWGDGGAHAHVWFIARPARMPQLRGSFMGLWDDFLPPIPPEVRAANIAFVAERLVARHGGGVVDG